MKIIVAIGLTKVVAPMKLAADKTQMKIGMTHENHRCH
jgi:hypothetical protein